MRSLERIAIVSGEASGDILGAGLIQALKHHYPECHFEGIGGPRMLEQGFVSHYPQDRLAVMGLIEPLKRLPELLAIRRDLRKRYTTAPPDLFIGIDSPDFNLALEAVLRKNGTKTVHYVSPSVWAWRQGRIKTIARAVDLMLTLFPFEADFYRQHRVGVEFVGHPLADDIDLTDQKAAARERIGLPKDELCMALLPGSRQSEVEKLGSVFLETASRCAQQMPELTFLVAAAGAARRAQIEQQLESFPDLSVRVSEGNSHDVMAAADVVLITSGTTTLEALLLKRPMVIGYRVAPLTYWILKRMAKTRFVGLPNLLANRALVPEFIQDDMVPENLCPAVMELLRSQDKQKNLVDAYTAIHQSLRRNTSERAAEAVLALWRGNGSA